MTNIGSQTKLASSASYLEVVFSAIKHFTVDEAGDITY